jgi:uncharacterized protein YxeA
MKKVLIIIGCVIGVIVIFMFYSTYSAGIKEKNSLLKRQVEAQEKQIEVTKAQTEQQKKDAAGEWLQRSGFYK